MDKHLRIIELRSILPELMDEKFQKLEQFCAAVKNWNRRVNLVSRQDIEQLWEHHLLPSIILLCIIDIPSESRLLDIGSGGGFPALPLKIMRPDLYIVMVDSLRKKSLFLQKAVMDLKLENVAVTKERVESLGNHIEFQKKFDIVTARAVGAINKLLNWGKPFLKESGYFLLWKGLSDIPDLENLSYLLNFKYKVYSVPEEFQHLSPKFKEIRWFMIRW